MKIKLITGNNAQELEETIAQWLEEIKKDADSLVSGDSQWKTSRAVIDFINIHHLFQTMQIVFDGKLIQMNAQQQATYQLCVFIFYTLK